ncbi:hypothetical protein ACSQ67_016784 [Phaseolus vulgaris]
MTDDLEDSFCNSLYLHHTKRIYKVETYFDVNPRISIPGQGESSELLNDGDKSDYDWLLAPETHQCFLR